MNHVRLAKLMWEWIWNERVEVRFSEKQFPQIFLDTFSEFEARLNELVDTFDICDFLSKLNIWETWVISRDVSKIIYSTEYMGAGVDSRWRVTKCHIV